MSDWDSVRRIPQSPDSAQFTVIRYAPRNPKENAAYRPLAVGRRQKSLQSFFLHVCQTKPLRIASVSSISQTDQGVFVFAGNPFLSGLWQRDSLPGSCSAVCHWMYKAPQVTLYPRRGNPLLCSSHQGLQNSRQSFVVSGKSEFEFTFLYDTWFSLPSSGFKIIPIRRLYAITIDRQQPPIIQLLTVKHLHT